MSDLPRSERARGRAREGASGAPLRVSVAIRSFRRLPALLELVTALLAQDYPDFEIVVIEQSPDQRAAYEHELAQLASDPRVRILLYAPLGAGRARIEAAAQCRGDIILFIDDDDLPFDSQLLAAHAANYLDPSCMAVSGRQVHRLDEDTAPYDTDRNRRLCLRYSFLLMPRGRVRHGTRLTGVTQISGSNGSIRRSAIERAGGWDPEDDHDEDSFNFRFARVRRPGEYFAYDPLAIVLRRLDLMGGMGRRQQTVAERIHSELAYSHRVVRKYHPGKFFALYPAYLYLAGHRAVRHVKESNPDSSLPRLVLDALRTGPSTYAEILRTGLATLRR